jgi:hypothetical protein
MFWPHSIPLNSFNVLTMANSSIFVNAVFVLRIREFLTKEHNRPVILSNYCPQLFAGDICVNLNYFRKVQIGQNHIFSNCSFYMIKCSLMYLIPMPGCLFSFFGFSGFGLTALPNQLGKRGKHIAPSCPEVTVMLYHA